MIRETFAGLPMVVDPSIPEGAVALVQPDKPRPLFTLREARAL